MILRRQNDKTTWRVRLVRYAPLVVWVGVIFAASSSAGASGNTSMFIRPLLEWLFPSADAVTLDIYHGYIRKLAHLTEYAVLAILASLALITSSRQLLQRLWFLIAFGVVLTVASADEFNQSFNQLRTGTVSDVLIDSAGGLIGILLVSGVIILRRKIKRGTSAQLVK